MSKGRKILFVLPRMGGGGAERVIALLANAFADEGDKISIYTLVSGSSFYELHQSIDYSGVGITVNRSNKLTALMSQVIALPKSFFSIRKRIKEGNFDVVISFLVETDILVGLCKLTGVRFRHVCSERNDPTMRSSIQRMILGQVYKNASLFVCQSNRVSQFYRCVPDECKIVIPNPINPNLIPAREFSARKRVVAVGRLMTQKNFQLLINAFSEVYKDFPEYVLDIYGEGHLRCELQELIDNNNMTSHITLRGAHSDVLKQIADADLFVMSSDYEGFPNVLLEAMAIGLPVISTDFSTGVAQELIGNENGRIVPVNDKDALIAAMQEILSDVELQKEMSTNNIEKVKKYYTSAIIPMWDDALNRVIGSR